MTTLTYTGKLVVTSCWCGIRLAIPDSLYRERAERGPGESLWCPLGHTFIYGGDAETTKLKRELQWERDRRAADLADLDGARASLRATKGVVTKLRKRTAAGACPYCGQHLRDLERHVNRQHAAEAAEAIAEPEPES
jgi:hypothetical protein